MKIACIGTQCIGKTTYINDFIKKWPMYRTPEKTYRDAVKNNGIKINEDGSEESQEIILNFLVDQVIEESKNDFVILDRSVLDNLAYTMWLFLEGKVSEEFLDKTRKIVRETLKLYDILFFFPISKFSKISLTKDGLRSINEKYRQEIDEIFKVFQGSYLQSDGKVFPTVDCPAMIEMFGTPEDRIALTSLYINKDGNPYGDDDSLVSDLYLPPEKKIIVP